MAVNMKGVNVFKKRDGAPDFVMCKLSINPEMIFDNIHEVEQYRNGKGWINLDILVGDDGSPYAKVNTYGQNNKQFNNNKRFDNSSKSNIVDNYEVSDEDVPF